MTVEHHESAKKIKENVLKNFREELGHLKDVLPQPKASKEGKEKTVEWKKTAEAVNDTTNLVDVVVNTEKNEKKIEKGKEAVKALGKYSSNQTAFVNGMKNAIDQNPTLSDIFEEMDNEWKTQFSQDIDTKFSDAYYG